MAKGTKASITCKVEFTKGWDKLKALLSYARMTPAVNRYMEQATRFNCLKAVRAVRNSIRTPSVYGGPPNAPLTIFIKGSSKPLVHHSELFKAVTYKVFTPFTAEVGILKGNKVVNIAISLHQGQVIKVTPKMRGLFARLADAGRFRKSFSPGSRRGPGSLTGRAAELWAQRPNKKWKALKPGTTHIRVPPRPYMKAVLESKALLMEMQNNWVAALGAALAGTKPELT